MSELFIINTVLDEQKLNKIKKNNLKKKIYYINFKEDYNLDFNSKNFIKLNSINSFQLFCKVKIKNIFKKIKFSKISNQFWNMKISEFNLADNFWKDFLKKEFVLKIIKKKKIKTIRLFTDADDYSFNKFIMNFKGSNLNIIKKNVISKKYFFQKYYFIGIYLIKIINFLKEIKNIQLIKSVRQKKLNSYKDIFIANYPDHFNKNLEINYFKNQNNFFYYVSLIRNNSNIFKYPDKKNFEKIKNLNNFGFVEREISYLDVFKNYFYKNLFISQHKIKHDLNVVGFKNYHEKFINYYYRHVELPKLLTYDQAIKNILKKLSPDKYVHYGYYEFVEGRVITKNLHKSFLHSKAYQHGFMGFFQKIRSIEVLKILKKFQVPKKIMFFQHGISKNIKNIDIQFKEKSSNPNNKLFLFNKKKLNILIFSDLHNIKSYNNFLLSLKVTKNINFFFRPHPKNMTYYKNYFSKKLFKNVTLDTTNDYKKSISKYKINFIITSSYTGILNEVIKIYWPILILNFENKMPNLNIDKNLEKNFIITNGNNIDFKKYYSNKMRNVFIKSINKKI